MLAKEEATWNLWYVLIVDKYTMTAKHFIVADVITD